MSETQTETRIEELEEKLDKKNNPGKHAKELWNQRYKDFEIDNLSKNNYPELNLTQRKPPSELGKLKAPCIRFQAEDLASKIALSKSLLNHDKPTLNCEIWGANGYVEVKNKIREQAVDLWDTKRSEFLRELKSERSTLATKIAEKIQGQVDEYRQGDNLRSERFRIYYETFPLWDNTTTTPLGGKATPDDSELWRLVKEVRVNKIDTQGGVQNRIFDLELDKPWKNIWGYFLERYVSRELIDKATLTMKSFRQLIHRKGEIKREIARYYE